MKYEVLEHTADVMIRCTGTSLEECFENASYALMDQIVDAKTIEAKEEFSFEIEGKDYEEKLFQYLSEILFLQDADSYVFSKFSVNFDGDKLYAKIWGEPLDLKKHHPKTEVKAITYHMMKIDENKPELQVVFDV